MVPDAVNGAPEHTPQAVNEANKVCGLQQDSVALQ